MPGWTKRRFRRVRAAQEPKCLPRLADSVDERDFTRQNILQSASSSLETSHSGTIPNVSEELSLQLSLIQKAFHLSESLRVQIAYHFPAWMISRGRSGPMRHESQLHRNRGIESAIVSEFLVVVGASQGSWRLEVLGLARTVFSAPWESTQVTWSGPQECEANSLRPLPDPGSSSRISEPSHLRSPSSSRESLFCQQRVSIQRKREADTNLKLLRSANGTCLTA